MRKFRLRFWLLVLDATVHLDSAASRLRMWAVGKASDATDWGAPDASDWGKPGAFDEVDRA